MDVEFETIVVDNNSADNTEPVLQKEFPQVIQISNNENLGFAKANNQGIGLAKGEYILLLNSDTVVLENALEKMVRFLDQTLDAAGVGCTLLNADGSLQPSVYAFFTLSKHLSHIFCLSRLLPKNTFFRNLLGTILRPVFRRTFGSYWSYGYTQEVDYAKFACFMIRKEAIQDVGLLDENHFMYGEDAEWCYRAKMKGWKIYFYPNAKVIHLNKPRVFRDDHPLLYEQYWAVLYFYQKYYPKWKLAFLKLGILIGFCIKIGLLLIVSPFRSSINVRRRLAVYRRILQLAVSA